MTTRGRRSDAAEIPSTAPAEKAAPAVSSPTEAADAAPATTTTTEPAYEAPAVTAMGDYGGGPASESTETTEIATSSPSSQEETTDEAPAVTAMGDNAGPAGEPAETTEIGTSSPSSQESTYEAPAVTPMGDVGTPLSPAQDNPVTPTQTTTIGSSSPSSQEETYEGPTYTPMGDLAIPATESSTAPETTAPAPIADTQPDGIKADVTAAAGPFGATLGFALDSQNTSITFGPAEGFGLFGSIGQGRAAPETTGGASVKLGIGPGSGELTALTTGITAKGNLSIPLNPGVNQVESAAITWNRDGTFTTTRTEGVSFGMQVGAASSQFVTLSVPNSTLDWAGNSIASMFGMGPPKPTGGGW